MTSVSSTSSTTTSSTTSTSSSIANSASVTTTGTTTSTSIDWDTLIESAYNAKLAKATAITTKITANEAKITAYEKLQSLLSTLKTDTASLSSSIINSLSGSVFATRSATLTSTGDVSASSALSMSIDDGAATGDHTLTISQIATAQKVLGTSVSDETSDLGYTGVFSLGLSGGTSANISITSTMSLSDIADAINAQTSTTDVKASIIQVSSSSYELMLSATSDNATIATSSVSGTDIMNTLGITNSSGSFSDIVQAAQPAKFTLDGVSLSRDTNDISDVLSGVTFNLLQATGTGATINISIDADTDSIETALSSLVTDYNAFRDYVVTQQATDSDGTASSDAVLFGDGTMRDIMNQITSALNSSVGDLSMSDLGLSFDENDDLVLDSTTLETALTDNFDGVMGLLATTLTPSSSSLTVVNTSTSPPASFTLDVTVDSSGALSSVSVGGDSSLFTVSGTSIIGASGTIYAGIAFTYTGSTSQSIKVTSSTGIASTLNSIAKTASNTTSGSLQTLIDNLTTQDDTLQEKADTITSQAATYEANLKVRYAKYQSAIESANSTLTYLKALLNASSS